MSKNEYAQQMDGLYTTLSSFIHKPPTNSLEHYAPLTVRIRTILDKISNQLGLFRNNNRDEIHYYNHITYYILECYQLLQRITPIVVDQEIKCQLLDKTMLLFNIYVQLMDDDNARKRIYGIKGSIKKQQRQIRATTILLPRIVAKHLTKNSMFMDHDFFKSIFIEVEVNRYSQFNVKHAVIEYLTIHQEQIKIDKIIFKNKELFENLIYAILEDFFNEVKQSKGVSSAEHWLDGNYSYNKFGPYEKFSNYKSKINLNLENNKIFKTIKSIIKQCIASDVTL